MALPTRGAPFLQRPAKVWNRYFEAVALEHVTLVVTEAGAFSPGELSGRRAGMRVPIEVRAWAEQRGRGHPDGSGA